MDIDPELFTSPAFTPLNSNTTMSDNMEEVKTEATKIDSGVSPSPTSNTPRKRGRKPTTIKAENAAEIESPPTTPNKRGRPRGKAGGGTAGTGAGTGTGTGSGGSIPGPIPLTYEAAGIADRMILRMRDDEHRPWTEIHQAWVQLTGVKVGASTPRMRYTTMKANFVAVSSEDEARLLRIKKEIEDKFEQEKWARIAVAIEDDGGAKYPPATLQKKFKLLAKQGGGKSASSNNSSTTTPSASSSMTAPPAGTTGAPEADAVEDYVDDNLKSEDVAEI